MAGVALLPRGAKPLPGDRPARGTPLTRRERQLVELLVSGKCPTNPELGRAMGLTVGTIKRYFCIICAKTGVKRKQELYCREISKPEFLGELQRQCRIPEKDLEWHTALQALLVSESGDREIACLILERWKPRR